MRVAEVEGFEGVGRGVMGLELTDYREHERSLTEFLEDFPGVTREDAIAALEEARISLAAALK